MNLNGRHDLAPVKRFWLQVNKRGPIHPTLKTRCWEWTGNLTGSKPFKYGCIYVDNKGIRSHRFSWMIHFGDLLPEIKVCHHCDNPKCVNPQHLFIGTSQDNAIDMVSKGRQNDIVGEMNGNAILTNEDVLSIRRRFKLKHHIGPLRRSFGWVSNARMLAQEFNITQEHVRAVARGRAWKHLNQL